MSEIVSFKISCENEVLYKVIQKIFCLDGYSAFSRILSTAQYDATMTNLEPLNMQI